MSFQPQFQIWRVKQQLIALNEDARSLERHRQLTVALITIEAWDDAIKLARGIDNVWIKAKVLTAVAESFIKLNDPDKAAALLDRLGSLIPGIADSSQRDAVWVVLSAKAAHLENWSQARKFADGIGSESSMIDALSRIHETWAASQSTSINFQYFPMSGYYVKTLSV